MLYFAYGSNMSVRRLKGRVASCQRIGLGTLFEHKLLFHKISSVDGSGKCAAQFTGASADKVIGVLYRVSAQDLATLDEIEGAGYERVDTMCHHAGKAVAVQAYLATHIDPALKPLHWYRQHVLYGARENRMPDNYIEYLESIPFVFDTDRSRTDRELSVYD